MSVGDWGYQAVATVLPGDFQAWPESVTTDHPVPDDLSDVLNYNALADVPDLPNLGTEIGREFTGEHFPFHLEQFSPDSLFDFDAFNIDQTGSLPLETSQPTTRLQPSHGAPTTGSD